MSYPTVGIVVRTRDRADFLRRALTSITGQSFESWTAVIVNDGGDPVVVDGIVAEVSKSDQSKIVTVHHETPRGRWQSANAGVLATSTPLLVLHDDDDTWHTTFLERAVDYLNKNPTRGAVVSRIEIVWERRSGVGFEQVSREIFQADATDPLLSEQLLFNRFVPIGFLYRRRLHQELGLYDESIPVVGDWAFTMRVLAKEPLEYLGDEPLAYWHQRLDPRGVDGNSVRAAGDDHRRFDARIRDDALREYVEQNGAGLPLYLTKYIDDRLRQTEDAFRESIRVSLRQEFVATTEGRIRNTLGRAYRRLKRPHS